MINSSSVYTVLILLIGAVVVAVYYFDKASKLNDRLNILLNKEVENLATIEVLNSQVEFNQNQIQSLQNRVNSLSKYEGIYDLEQKIEILKTESQKIADATINQANAKGEQIIEMARQNSEAIKNTAADVIEQANVKSSEIIEIALQKSEVIKKSAADAVEEANRQKLFLENEGKRKLHDAEIEVSAIFGAAHQDYKEFRDLKKSLTALQNTIEGYGDSYIVPSHSFIDTLADQYGYTEYAKELKIIRKEVKNLSANGLAAVCDYVEKSRKDTAVRFVTDAFNGKVDSILSEVSDENYGVLSQRILDSFTLVNLNGKAFRNAVITKDYLELRLTELRLASSIEHIKTEEKAEQKRIREQIREEERARREYEKAIKEAAKEEEIIKKAMEKVRSELQHASQEERDVFESKIKDLSEKLKAAEDKNKRAMSMAQQTKQGHIYIISNIGSFGENIYKIGMTRRLDPYERVKELGDASVPFEFDVHAIVFSDDAPKFEKEMHKAFAMSQVNKVNARKEFFKVDLKSIRQKIEEMKIEVNWTMASVAAEYKETLAIEKSLKTDRKYASEWEDQFIHKIDEMQNGDRESIGVN